MADEELLQAGGCRLGLGLGLELGTSLGLVEQLWAGAHLGLGLGYELCLGLELERLARGNSHILQLDHCWQGRQSLGAEDGARDCSGGG